MGPSASFSIVTLLTLVAPILCGKTLVLLDNLITRHSHSIFFKALSDRYHILTFKLADDPNLQLFEYGEPLYDNLVLFCPTVQEFGGSINVPEIVKFIDQGGNVIIGANSMVGPVIREIANEVNFEFDDEKSFVIDHANWDFYLDDGNHTTVIVEPTQLIKASSIVGQSTNEPFLFKGVGLVVDKPSPLTLQIATGSSSAYSHEPTNSITQYPHAVGKSVVLIGALQARNNARVLLTGSLDSFSDKFFQSKVSLDEQGKIKERKAGNERLAKALADWTFKEQSVLRVKSVNHHRVGEKTAPIAYTIKDRVEFSIEIEEYKNGRWVAYLAPDGDIQLEFVRIDPFVRTDLKADKQVKGRYSVQFMVPDEYGVYKFVVDYNRLGLTYLLSVTQVSVRPFEHTQFERFIRSAYPYYVSAFSMMAGVILFSCVFLHFKDQSSVHKRQS